VATVTSYTKDAIDAIVNGLVATASINGSNHLVLTKHDGTTVDVGDVNTGLASDLVTIAALSPANDDVIQRKSGAWANRSMVQLAADLTATNTFQPKNSNLTTISGLSPANDDVLQRKAGVWTNRTLVQYAADLTSSLVQPKAADLTTIAGLSPANDDFLQRKSGAWANRSLAQVWADLSPVGYLDVAKTAALNRVTSTLSLDPDLQVTLVAGVKYKVELSVNFQVATGGFKWGFVTPTVTGAFTAIFNLSGTGMGDYGYVWNTSSQVAAVQTSPNGGLYIRGFLTATTGGTFGLQWANGSGANSTTIGGGSEMTLRPYV
jgi:hypothetical protein